MIAQNQDSSIRITERILETSEHNTYTIEKQDVRKLIHPAPWCDHNEIMGHGSG